MNTTFQLEQTHPNGTTTTHFVEVVADIPLYNHLGVQVGTTQTKRTYHPSFNRSQRRAFTKRNTIRRT